MEGENKMDLRSSEADCVLCSVTEAEVSLDEMLSLACRQGKQDIVELLLESGAHMNHRNKGGNTPLLEACSQGHVNVAHLLLDRGAAIDAPTESTSDSALTWACTLGNDQIVDLLLERGANVEHRTKDGCTALMFAALAGHVHVAELLLDHQAEINVQSDSNKDSPLTFACWKGHCEVVDLLLSRMANIEHRTKEGFTPLMFAALGGHTNVAKLLLERGAAVNVPSGSNNDIPLTSACWKGHHDVVKLLLEYRSDLEHRTKDGCTPLMLAAREGHLSVAMLILEYGADLNVPSGSENNIPLTLACWKGHVDVVELLLHHSSDLEHHNKAGCTPLMLAAREGHVDATELLLEHGAEINVPSGSNDDTPLTLACWKGHHEVVELLLQHKSNVDHQTKTGCTPLMEATREGHVLVAQLLLQYGADVETPDNYGQSPLFMACWKGHARVARLLLERNANRDCRTKTGITPLFQACRENHIEVVRLLLDYGCAVNAPFPNSSRENPLTLASEKGHVDLVRLLLDRGGNVEVRTKKGATPFLLAAREGHLEICIMLWGKGADSEVVDTRNTTPLIASFRNGHVEVVQWLLDHVKHFPSDDECQKALLAPCPPDRKHQEMLSLRSKCVDLIMKGKAKKKEAAERNAQILFNELDAEKEREETRRQAAARKRDKRKRKKREQAEARREAEIKANQDAEEEDGAKAADLAESDDDEELSSLKADVITGSSSTPKTTDDNDKRQDMPEDVAADEENDGSRATTSSSKRSKKNKNRRKNRAARAALENGQVQVNNVDENVSPSAMMSTSVASVSPQAESTATSSRDAPPAQRESSSRHGSQQHRPTQQASQQAKSVAKLTSMLTKGTPSSTPPRPPMSRTRTPAEPSFQQSTAQSNALRISSSGDLVSSKASSTRGNSSTTGAGGLARSPVTTTSSSFNSSNAMQTTVTTSGHVTDSSQRDAGIAAVMDYSVYDGDMQDGWDTSVAPNTSSHRSRKSTPSTSSVTSSSGLDRSAEVTQPGWQEVGRGGTRGKEPAATLVSPGASAAQVKSTATSSGVAKTVQLSVLNSLVGRIIGKAGSKINAITEASGAQINVARPQSRAPDRIVTIKGSPKQISKAQSLIQDALRNADREQDGLTTQATVGTTVTMTTVSASSLASPQPSSSVARPTTEVTTTHSGASSVSFAAAADPARGVVHPLHSFAAATAGHISRQPISQPPVSSAPPPPVSSVTSIATSRTGASQPEMTAGPLSASSVVKVIDHRPTPPVQHMAPSSSAAPSPTPATTQPRTTVQSRRPPSARPAEVVPQSALPPQQRAPQRPDSTRGAALPSPQPDQPSTSINQAMPRQSQPQSTPETLPASPSSTYKSESIFSSPSASQSPPADGTSGITQQLAGVTLDGTTESYSPLPPVSQSPVSVMEPSPSSPLDVDNSFVRSVGPLLAHPPAPPVPLSSQDSAEKGSTAPVSPSGSQDVEKGTDSVPTSSVQSSVGYTTQHTYGAIGSTGVIGSSGAVGASRPSASVSAALNVALQEPTAGGAPPPGMRRPTWTNAVDQRSHLTPIGQPPHGVEAIGGVFPDPTWSTEHAARMPMAVNDEQQFLPIGMTHEGSIVNAGHGLLAGRVPQGPWMAKGKEWEESGSRRSPSPPKHSEAVSGPQHPLSVFNSHDEHRTYGGPLYSQPQPRLNRAPGVRTYSTHRPMQPGMGEVPMHSHSFEPVPASNEWSTGGMRDTRIKGAGPHSLLGQPAVRTGQPAPIGRPYSTTRPNSSSAGVGDHPSYPNQPPWVVNDLGKRSSPPTGGLAPLLRGTGTWAGDNALFADAGPHDVSFTRQVSGWPQMQQTIPDASSQLAQPLPQGLRSSTYAQGPIQGAVPGRRNVPFQSMYGPIGQQTPLTGPTVAAVAAAQANAGQTGVSYRQQPPQAMYYSIPATLPQQGQQPHLYPPGSQAMN